MTTMPQVKSKHSRPTPPSTGQVAQTTKPQLAAVRKTVDVATILSLLGSAGAGGVAIGSSLGVVNPFFAIIPLSMLLVGAAIRSQAPKAPATTTVAAPVTPSTSAVECVRPRALFQDKGRPVEGSSQTWMMQQVQPISIPPAPLPLPHLTVKKRRAPPAPVVFTARAVIPKTPTEEILDRVIAKKQEFKALKDQKANGWMKGFFVSLEDLRKEISKLPDSKELQLANTKLFAMGALLSLRHNIELLTQLAVEKNPTKKRDELLKLKTRLTNWCVRIKHMRGKGQELGTLDKALHDTQVHMLSLQEKAERMLAHLSKGNRLKSSATNTLGNTAPASRPKGSRSR